MANEQCGSENSWESSQPQAYKPAHENQVLSDILPTQSLKLIPGSQIHGDILPTQSLKPVPKNQFPDNISPKRSLKPVPGSQFPDNDSPIQSLKPVPGDQVPGNDLPTSKLNPVSLSLNLIKLAQGLQALHVNKIGDDFDERTQELVKYNFGLENEEKYFNSSQLIAKCGYPLEEYTVETPDGYLLNLLHIRGTGPPVYIMHGFLSSSDDFLTSGCEKSLAFVLFLNGYDVWLANARGNKYSRKHVTLNPDTDKKFWNFDWHEIAVIDLPTIIDFILEKTDRQKLYYIGHSQGTTTAYVLFSEKPEYNDKIIVQVTISPIAWMSHSFSPLMQLLAQFVDEGEFLEEMIGPGEFVPHYQLVNTFKTAVCGTSASAVAVCNPLVSSLFGFNLNQVNFTLYPVQSNHLPSGASSRQLIHYLQLTNSGKLQQFDYGKQKNKKIYGRSTPPSYDVSKISSKVAIYFSDNDWVSSVVDVEILASKLPNLEVYYKVPLPFDHLDFLWGKSAEEIVYSDIISLFEENQP